MTYPFSGNLQQHGERANGYRTNYPPRSYHRDPPSPTDMPQEASSDGRQIKDDPDDGQNFGVFLDDLRGQPSGSNFVSSDGSQHGYHHEMFPYYQGGNQYGQELKMEDIALALEDSQNSMMEHPSPGSDGYPAWDEQDVLPSPDNASLHIDAMPSHHETELYLRQNLSIFAPRPVNLTALPDEPFGTRLPKITELIKLAIWGSTSKRLTLRQIYDAIEARYPSWKSAGDKPWQRSIRHNLSLKAIFVRVERPSNHPGKGCYWALDVRQGEGNKRDRRRKDQVTGSSRSSVSDDSDEDDRNHSRGQNLPYGPPQNILQPAGSTHAVGTHEGYNMLPTPPDHHYSEQLQMTGPHMRWNPSTSSPHLQHYSHPTMAPPGMHMSRANTYPPMGLPPQAEHYLPMQGGGPMMPEHGYPFPQMLMRQTSAPAHNPPPPPRARRPHSDISPEEDGEDIARGSRRHRAH